MLDWMTAKRIFRAGVLDFSRNAFVSIASILVMTVTLFVVGVTMFAGVILGATLEELRDEVTSYLGATPQEFMAYTGMMEDEFARFLNARFPQMKIGRLRKILTLQPGEQTQKKTFKPS